MREEMYTFKKHIQTLIHQASWSEANMWSNFRFGRGPMTIDEYENYKANISKEAADDMLRLRALTTFGWWLWGVWTSLKGVFQYSLYKEEYEFDMKEFKDN